jgi:hypothetical protein
MKFAEKVAKLPKLDMITFIKITSLIYMAIFDVFIGIGITTIMDKYIFTKKFNVNDENKSIVRLSFEVSLIMGILASLSYIFRNIVQLIPFPFDNQYGFQLEKVKEYQSAVFLNVALVFYNNTLSSKVAVLKKKLTG